MIVLATNFFGVRRLDAAFWAADVPRFQIGVKPPHCKLLFSAFLRALCVSALSFFFCDSGVNHGLAH